LFQTSKMQSVNETDITLRAEKFISMHNPSEIVTFFDTIHPSSSTRPSARDACKRNKETVNMNLRHALISSPEYPRCFSNSTVEEHVIIDSGALVCISPYKTDFKTYCPSRMQIKDLSLTNKVTGEGLIQCQLEHKNGHTVKIEVFSYHIPTAKVRLLSPQVIINDSGGYAMITGKGIDINLGDDIDIGR
jgi:hypothetical protein